MSQPRFLADHDFNGHILHGVSRREPAVEILRVADVGSRDWPDEIVLQHAAENGLIVLSHDTNTMIAAAVARMREGQLMTGLAVAEQDKPVVLIVESIILIWAASDAEEWIDIIRFLPI